MFSEKIASTEINAKIIATNVGEVEAPLTWAATPDDFIQRLRKAPFDNIAEFFRRNALFANSYRSFFDQFVTTTREKYRWNVHKIRQVQGSFLPHILGGVGTVLKATGKAIPGDLANLGQGATKSYGEWNYTDAAAEKELTSGAMQQMGQHAAKSEQQADKLLNDATQANQGKSQFLSSMR